MFMKIRLLFLSLLAGMFLQAQNLSVIGNPNGTPATMSQARLSSIFKGEIKAWENGTKIFLAMMKSNTALGGLTCTKVFQMNCDGVTKYWLGKAIESNSSAPAFFNTVGELQAFVAGKPGAIGIIDLTAPAAGVRLVTIDGKNSF